MQNFLIKLATIPDGYSEGLYNGQKYGTTKSVSEDGKRIKLYAEDLGGSDHISFNLYMLKGNNPRLKPCEMPSQKVIDFVLGYSTLTHI